MIQNFTEGGLKMIDIMSFNKALKTGCGIKKKYLDGNNNGKWKLALMPSLNIWKVLLYLKELLI